MLKSDFMNIEDHYLTMPNNDKGGLPDRDAISEIFDNSNWEESNVTRRPAAAGRNVLGDDWEER